MPKPRLAANKELPKRWRFFHGAYWYRVPPGLEAQWGGKKDYRLGVTLADAHRAFAERVGAPVVARTIGELLDQYALEVVPTKAPVSRTTNLIFIKKLRGRFGHMPLTDIRPTHIYQYVRWRSAKVSAQREVEILSHAYTKAVEWGLLDRHPLKGQVRLTAPKARTRYVEDWEVQECLSLPAKRGKGSVLMVQAYIRLKLLTGLARSDLLRLRQGVHLRDDGIHVTRHKTNTRPTVYTYAKVPERRDAVDACLAARPALSPFLFCNRRGEGYINEDTGECHGFDSIWSRFMDRVLKETKVTQRFTEHDLRAKVSSDAGSLERARALLQLASVNTALKFYRRKAEVV